jgi:hypothetical protein
MSAQQAYIDAKLALQDAMELVALSQERIDLTEERLRERMALESQWRDAIERSRKILAAHQQQARVATLLCAPTRGDSANADGLFQRSPW